MRKMTWVAAPAAMVMLAGVTLAACGDREEKAAETAAPAAPSSETLATALKGADGMGRLESVVANAGLETVLEGVGPYTVFAPADAAFTGTTAADLSAADGKAPAAALVRAHIVPGALSRRDITAALDRAGTGKVEMRTMADGLLTFTRDGEAVVVTGPDGAAARLSGQEAVVRNGVIQPVDALLVRPQAQSAG